MRLRKVLGRGWRRSWIYERGVGPRGAACVLGHWASGWPPHRRARTRKVPGPRASRAHGASVDLASGG
eukprot:7937688-Pyramimonas_sp.AAC.1